MDNSSLNILQKGVDSIFKEYLNGLDIPSTNDIIKELSLKTKHVKCDYKYEVINDETIDTKPEFSEKFELPDGSTVKAPQFLEWEPNLYKHFNVNHFNPIYGI